MWIHRSQTPPRPFSSHPILTQVSNNLLFSNTRGITLGTSSSIPTQTTRLPTQPFYCNPGPSSSGYRHSVGVFSSVSWCLPSCFDCASESHRLRYFGFLQQVGGKKKKKKAIQGACQYEVKFPVLSPVLQGLSSSSLAWDASHRLVLWTRIPTPASPKQPKGKRPRYIEGATFLENRKGLPVYCYTKGNE